MQNLPFMKLLYNLLTNLPQRLKLFKFTMSLLLGFVSLHASTHSVCETERADVQKAKEAVELILMSEPTNTICMLQLANIYLKQGKISKGFEILVDAYSIDPHNVQNSPISSVLPFALKVTNLKKQANQTNDKELWNKLGDGYAEMGIFNEATLMYKNSLQVDASQQEIRLKLALSLQKNCQTYSAIDELKGILAKENQNIYANYYLGKILAYDIKNQEEATDFFTKAKKALVGKKESFNYLEYTNLLSDISKELKE